MSNLEIGLNNNIALLEKTLSKKSILNISKASYNLNVDNVDIV